MIRFSSLTLLILALAAPGADVEKAPSHPLLESVKEITAPGQPGSLAVFGPQAAALVAGGATVQETVIACAQWESGRVVAYAHDGYLDPATFGVADTGRLFFNAVAWTTGAKKDRPRVGVRDNDALVKHLQDRGVAVQGLAGKEWWQSLKEVDVLVVRAPVLQAPEARDAVQAFVKRGGGLLIADTGWGWALLHPGKSLIADHPGNQLLRPAGLLWTGGTSARTSPRGYRTEALPAPYLHAGVALDAVLRQQRGQLRLSEDDQVQCAQTIALALSVLPPDDEAIVKKLRDARETVGRDAVPTPKTPIRAKDGLLRALVALDVNEMRTRPAREVKAHPAAASFPGDVPQAARAVDRKLTIDTHTPGWHSTGLYARAGDLVTVTLPAAAADRGLHLRIGCHSDALWHHKEWKRMPELCCMWPLREAATEAAHALGGLVYLVVPEPCALGKVEVQIAGAVEAPLFVLGETTRDDWIARRSKLPGPWAELATKKLILTVPSRVVRDLRDPDELLKTWDQVMDACAQLARIPADRVRPERFVLDEQISAGYMHSGYPLMAHLDVEKTIVDSQMIARGEGTWGFFHEIGHNHQAPEWTFDGTGEVTVNLFTMYAHEKVCKRADLGTRQNGANLIDEAERNKKIRPYFANGARFADWKADPFLALCMYIQLQQAFGWEAFQDVFEEYRKLPKTERPRNDDEKRDQWMVRFSRRVGKNLGPFFEAWGVPTTAAARAKLGDLPPWLPANFPPK
jgi:hypothetical protein